ncbi:glycosyltransferase [Crocosphaera sp. XPORK-15E]|uniref:glycosyltransferase n=1 Tax=Crocosphaera sp. XPORK-15E TaxID=3110247 RepID=UPI002B1F3E77|nr:glycosyltransferase [Crocosphaera sp. XPORK-15E]MEA5533084.1 glycosyltransferase [Crocosphaera sp. XPORK-15E]
MKSFLKKIAKKLPLTSNIFKKIETLQANLDLVTQENNSLTNELSHLSQEMDKLKTERQEYIRILYQYLLETETETSELNNYFNSNYNPREIINLITQSSPYQDQINKQHIERKNYVIDLYRYILDREPTPSEVNIHLNSKYNPIELFNLFTESQEYKDKMINETIDLDSILGIAKSILGEQKRISANMILSWYKNAAAELIHEHNNNKYLETRHSWELINPSKAKDSINNFIPKAAIITSLYRGKKFIKAFLENMINQTFFEHCELIIIDANSPENEQEIIKDYLTYYSNINYIKLQETIGIYEAWNLAIKESNSEFITNANVDDLHRSDGLELKIKALTENPLVDVVYSDVYYSFLENLPFEIVEKCNIRTNLPVANKDNLLQFNSPHNSPMWRRSLHNKIGYFDTSYQSAADYEFWLRAAFSGSSFIKLAEPVVLYYHNPQGMSTNQQTPGRIEGENIIKAYQNILNNSTVE